MILLAASATAPRADEVGSFSNDWTGNGIVVEAVSDPKVQGITCHLAENTHTFGSQWVEVATADGPYVLAGDCVYWYANVERMWPPGYVQGDTWRLIETYRELRGLVGEERLERIIPGHDMETFKRHPSWAVGKNLFAEVHLAAGEKSRAPGQN